MRLRALKKGHDTFPLTELEPGQIGVIVNGYTELHSYYGMLIERKSHGLSKLVGSDVLFTDEEQKYRVRLLTEEDKIEIIL